MTIHTTANDDCSVSEVRGLLREIGYVLWLSRMLAAEIKAEKDWPVRPEMSDFCMVDSAISDEFLVFDREFAIVPLPQNGRHFVSALAS